MAKRTARRQADPAAVTAAEERLALLLSTPLPNTEEAIRADLASLAETRRVLVHDPRITQYRQRLNEHLKVVRSKRDSAVETAHGVFRSPPRFSPTGASVGDVNFLLNTLTIAAPSILNALRSVIRDLTARTGGRSSESIDIVEISTQTSQDQRVIVRWNLDRSPTTQDLHAIHHIACLCYDQQIPGLMGQKKGWASVIRIRDAENHINPNRWAIEFGPDATYSALARGVTVSRLYGRTSAAAYLMDAHHDDWITRSVQRGPTDGFCVEIREGCAPDHPRPGGLEQSAFVMLVVHLGFYLAHGKVLDHRDLAIEVFKALNRVGAESTEKTRLFGLEETLETVERVLLLPLQRPALARQFQFVPESLLLVGVPGVGKSLLTKHLLGKDLNAILVAVSGLELHGDLTDDKKPSRILMRVDEIRKLAELLVVLLVEDIDLVMKNDDLVIRLLNMLQGVRERGVHLIASTNKPENIDSRLLEPGRFGKAIHVHLPTEAEREGQLRLMLHGLPFTNDNVRDEVCRVMAQKTQNWPGRHVWELKLEAGRVCGLRSTGSDIYRSEGEDAPPQPMTMADFEVAYELASKHIDVGAIVERDREIERFVARVNRNIGFRPTNE